MMDKIAVRPAHAWNWELNNVCLPAHVIAYFQEMMSTFKLTWNESAEPLPYTVVVFSNRSSLISLIILGLLYRPIGPASGICIYRRKNHWSIRTFTMYRAFCFYSLAVAYLISRLGHRLAHLFLLVSACTEIGPITLWLLYIWTLIESSYRRWICFRRACKNFKFVSSLLLLAVGLYMGKTCKGKASHALCM